jgi:von Willebrand factor type A domain
MSELANIFTSIVAQAAKMPESGIAKQYTQRIETGNPDTCCILLDTSGSMNHKCKENWTRLDILRKAVSSLDWESTQIFTFDSTVDPIKSPSEIEFAGGGTNLTLALEKIMPLNPSHTIIISDGEPDNQDTSISAANRLTGRISTIFIGDDSDRSAIEFMQELAKIGCGSTSLSNLSSGHAQLSQQIDKLMLPAS